MHLGIISRLNFGDAFFLHYIWEIGIGKLPILKFILSMSKNHSFEWIFAWFFKKNFNSLGKVAMAGEQGCVCESQRYSQKIWYWSVYFLLPGR